MARINITGNMTIYFKKGKTGKKKVYMQTSFGSKDQDGEYCNLYCFVNASEEAKEIIKERYTKEDSDYYIGKSEINVIDGFMSWVENDDGEKTFSVYIKECSDELEKKAPKKKTKTKTKKAKPDLEDEYDDFEDEYEDDLPF